MTLPAGGTISLSQVNVELSFASNAAISLDQPAVRTLFAKPSGLISLSDGYGKSAAFVFNPTISSQQNYNLRAAAVAAGWNQITPLFASITISPGAIIGSASTGAYAFDTGTTFPVGSSLSLVIGSGAYIVGAGGAGRNGVDFYEASVGGAGQPGFPGGPALRAQYAMTITNSGAIGGGGGGGGSMGGPQYAGGNWYYTYGGAGGGGGAGSIVGIAGQPSAYSSGSSAGGAGSLTVGGVGGVGAAYGSGGAGGNLGQVGGSGNPQIVNVIPGGGAGGAGGAAVVGNSNITWAVVGTRYGALT